MGREALLPDAKQPETPDSRFEKAIDAFAKRNGLHFNNKEVFKAAFTSPFLRNPDDAETDEHAEFLGDRLLNLKLGELLSAKDPKMPKSVLHRDSRMLGRNVVLSRIALETGMNLTMRISDIEARKEGFDQSDLLANTFEEFLWALKKDQGDEAVTEFVRKHIIPQLPEVSKQLNERSKTDAKKLSVAYPAVKPAEVILAGKDANLLKDLNPWIGWGFDGPTPVRFPLTEKTHATGVDALHAFRKLDDWNRVFRDWPNVVETDNRDVIALRDISASAPGRAGTLELLQSPQTLPGGMHIYVLYINGRRILTRACTPPEKRRVYRAAFDALGWQKERENAILARCPETEKHTGWIPRDFSGEYITGMSLGQLAESKLGRSVPIVLRQKPDSKESVYKTFALYIDGRLVHEDDKVIFTRLFTRNALAKLGWVPRISRSKIRARIPRDDSDSKIAIPLVTSTGTQKQEAAVERPVGFDTRPPEEWQKFVLSKESSSNAMGQLSFAAKKRNMRVVVRRGEPDIDYKRPFAIFLNDRLVGISMQRGLVRTASKALRILDTAEWDLTRIEDVWPGRFE